ncbi:MAG: hypothetical protein KBT03_13380 [Bacteroidales bacterium]|nr:hypothetical protein [Candidatus Scybalousia scybalohippi]
MIKFTKTNEIIDASRIVDQGSFKYTESSNDGDEIKLGFSESSSFEIDIKGDLVDRSGEEIYVEVIADDKTGQKTIPIGYFVISDVDYDYTLDKSHILSYSNILADKESEILIPPKVYGTKKVNNYYLNLMLDGFIPNDYISETKQVSLTKTLDNSGLYYYHTTNWTKKYENGSYRYYVTETVNLYRLCLYHFDSKYARMIYPYNHIFYKYLSNTDVKTSYRSEIVSDAYNYVSKTFWVNNPVYNPDNYSYSDKSSVYREITPSVSYCKPIGNYNNDLMIPFNNTPNFDYKLSYVMDTTILPRYARCYEKSGFRYATYTSSSATDYSRSVFRDDLGDVTWITSLPTITDVNYFDNVNVQYIVSHQYGNISEFNGGDLSQTTSLDFASDIAESNGDMLKINRADGNLVQYSLHSSDGIYPMNNIYPNNTGIYPSGDRNVVNISKDMYSSLISKTKQSKKVGKVVVNKLGVEYIAIVDDFDEKYYSTILIEENNLIDHNFIDAQTVADSILDKYKDNVFTPFELECTGLPWLEAGDWIVVETDDGQQRLNVNRRTLSGIQGMMDSLSAGGV